MNAQLKRIQAQVNLFARDLPSDFATAVSWMHVYADFVNAMQDTFGGATFDEAYASKLIDEGEIVLLMPLVDSITEYAVDLVKNHSKALRLKRTLLAAGFDAPKLDAERVNHFLAVAGGVSDQYFDGKKKMRIVTERLHPILSKAEISTVADDVGTDVEVASLLREYVKARSFKQAA